jgi:hypothetical protein
MQSEDIAQDVSLTDANSWRLNVQYSLHVHVANTRLLAVLSQADVSLMKIEIRAFIAVLNKCYIFILIYISSCSSFIAINILKIK